MKTAFTILWVAIGISSFAQNTLLYNCLDHDIFKDSGPHSFTKCGQYVYFLATGEDLKNHLWRTDGTPEGTVDLEVAALTEGFPIINALLPFGDTCLIHMNDKLLLVYDQTHEIILDEINFDYTYGINNKSSFVLNGNLYFWAKRKNETIGLEMWQTDGTKDGTKLFMEFSPNEKSGGVGGVYSQKVFINGKTAYFLASDGDSVGVYKTDGTTSGTEMIQNMYPEPMFTYQDVVTFVPELVNDHIIFRGLVMFSLDLTTEEIAQLEPFEQANQIPNTTFVYSGGWVLNDEYYYRVRWSEQTTPTATVHEDLRATDGENIRIVARDKYEGGGTIYPLQFTSTKSSANGKVFFMTHGKGLTNVQLWASDGTETGTEQVTDSFFVSGNGMDYFYTCGDRIFYHKTGNDHIVYEINTETYEFTELINMNGLSAPRVMLDEVNGRFYFPLKDADAGVEPHYNDVCGVPTNTNKILEKSEIQLFPNPASDFVVVSGMKNTKNSIEVYSASGKLVFSKVTAETSLKLMLDGLNQGVYILNLNGAFKKLIVE